MKTYNVTKEFMDELVAWRDKRKLDATIGTVIATVGTKDLEHLPTVAQMWWSNTDDPMERNNRTIAIIQWLNGEDVFEIEEAGKFVVRNDTPDDRGDYWYANISKGMSYIVFYMSQATKFDTPEEASEWCNSHQVVVEIDEDGNEV